MEAVPRSHSAEYLLEPASAAASEGGKGESELKGKGHNNDETETLGKEASARKKGGLVIFAVDVSGSMCTTTEVPALQGRFVAVLTLLH